MAIIKDVATRAGVSTTTVSHVINKTALRRGRDEAPSGKLFRNCTIRPAQSRVA